MSDPEVVVRLLAAIDETAADAAKEHDVRWCSPIPEMCALRCDDPLARDLRRLCQSHRDIVAMYQQAKDQPVRRGLGGLDHASAMGRLTTLGLVLQALARGYGIEDGDGGDE